MTSIFKALLAGAALIAAPAFAAPRDTPEQQLAKLLEGRTPGAPVNCISLATSNTSQIIKGKAIVYRVGSKLYVNEPRSGAESLNDDDILVTKVFGSQLCSIDTINLVDRSSQFPRGFVILDKFVPWTKVKPAAR
ncbi:hypothetical protein E5A73_15245 [Sphingomonas gei]|uniref:Uncharacterized protein n=1 Tax=Sphingomonas gei TaxID=1395960 RepID=A0A4S1X7T4_9SPHN|nr:hypothetical protein [Sphingomonas gei]TGX52161.1 hypothetical protein E5A73_15245 [Sphingomonas gei]